MFLTELNHVAHDTTIFVIQKSLPKRMKRGKRKKLLINDTNKISGL
jgi:hypothetical protein